VASGSASSGDLEFDIPPPSSPKDIAAVRAYVQSSPLFPQLKLNSGSLTDAAAETWANLAETACGFLHLDSRNLSPAAAARVYRYYVPTYLWCVGRIETHRRSANGTSVRPLVIGLTAPQGCGKTTLVAALSALFLANGIKAASASIDDAYLTGAEQDVLASSNAGNELLRYRGNAGTHDVGLAVDTLRALLGINVSERAGAGEAEPSPKNAERVFVPRYDKTARGGRGDRAPRDSWTEVTAPLDVVLFEGWMLGFQPTDETEAEAVHPDLIAVNAKLKNEKYDVLHALLDDWIVVRVRDTRWVKSWRLEAERASRDAGRPTLSDELVADFVNRFLPAYDLYAGKLYADGPWRGDANGSARDVDEGCVFAVEVDETRSVV
jgi:D-glycerate 3-kinase